MVLGLRPPHAICLVLLFGSADVQIPRLRVSGARSPVRALVGGDVTLPCLMSGVQLPLNLLVVRVTWKLRTHDGEELQVYHFESFRHSPSRAGSHMADSDLQQGNASLYIPRVQIGDDGEYVCTVLVSPDDSSAKFPVHVSVIPQAWLPRFVSIDLRHESSLRVSCHADMFYPDAIVIRWLKVSKITGMKSSMDGDACARLPSRNTDGTYNVTSTVIVSPSGVEEDGDEYLCVVSHRALDTKTTLTFTLHVTETKITAGLVILITIVVILSIISLFLSVILYMWKFQRERPQLSWINKDERIFHMEKAALFCHIKGFRPKKIHVNLFLERPNCDPQSSRELVHAWKSTDNPLSSNSSTAPGSLTASRRSSQMAAIIPLLERVVERRLLLPIEMKVEFMTSDNGTHNCECTIIVTPNADMVDGANLILEVQHVALRESISIQRSLQVIRFTPTVEMNIRKGQKKDDINITCTVKWTHPSFLYITWLKMKENENRQSSICSFPRSVGKGINGHLCHIIADLEELSDHVKFSSILILNKSGWKGAQFVCTIKHIHTGVWKTAEIQYRGEEEDSSCREDISQRTKE